MSAAEQIHAMAAIADLPMVTIVRVLEAVHKAGYAVIELPKPADKIDDGYLAHFFAPANGNFVRIRFSKDIVVDGNWYSPDQARDVAAAMLAAADAAEVTS